MVNDWQCQRPLGSVSCYDDLDIPFFGGSNAAISGSHDLTFWQEPLQQSATDVRQACVVEALARRRKHGTGELYPQPASP